MAKRIFVRLPNWLGDLLMSRPLLHALRFSFPDAHVAAMGPSASRLLERERVWDAWDAWPPDTPGKGVFDQAYDVAVILPPSFSSAWNLPGGISTRIGFAAEARSVLLTRAIRRPARGEVHLSREYLRLGEPLGARETTLPELAPTAEEQEEARTRLRGLGLESRAYVVLGPGAWFGPAKRWPEPRYVELGRRLVARGFAVLVCGAGKDRVVAENIAAGIGADAHALAGLTPVGEQLALCAGARATVSNDSGLAHLAAAAGGATFVIFGSTSSAWTAPLGPRVRVVQHAPVCSPCFQRTCRIGYRCLWDVTVDAVESACEASSSIASPMTSISPA